MCLILLAHAAHPRYPLVLAANRDEFHERPAAAAEFWPERPDLLGGRDLLGGGTWLGVTRSGRLAAVTNFRAAKPRPPEAASRGALVRDFLTGDESARDYARRAHEAGERYAGFCLLLHERGELWFCSNRDVAPPRRLEPGVYGLSNHLLDTAWSKVLRGKRELEAALDGAELLEPERLLDILADRSIPPESADGPTEERERALGAIFVRLPGYGTRCSTVVLLDREGGLTFVERSFAPDGETRGTVRFELGIG